MIPGWRKRALLLAVLVAIVTGIAYSSVGNLLTFANLQRHRDDLQLFVQQRYGLSVLIFIFGYVLVTGFSIPGGTVLTLAGGFLFGTAAATLYVNLGATGGATLAFLSARYLIGDRFQERYQQQLATFNGELDKHGPRYLLTLRFIPLFPFFLINVLAGITKIPLKTFLWTTSLGILPGTAVYAFAGREIGSIHSPKEILSGNVIMAFLILAVFALFPVVLDHLRQRKKPQG